jgi:hypothetical protein
MQKRQSGPFRNRECERMKKRAFALGAEICGDQDLWFDLLRVLHCVRPGWQARMIAVLQVE